MHPIWSGTISFGLVTIPVRLFPATKSKDISFHLLHDKDQARIKYQKVCSKENLEVPDGEIARAFEYQKDKFVILSEEELAAADPEMSRSIDILDFVDTDDIDPIYFVKPYYLAAQSGGGKAYALLAQALAKTGRLAVGQCVIRTKQYLVAVRPAGRQLLLSTMRYPDEIVDPATVGEGLEEAQVTEKELELAESLIDQMATRFEPEKYKDAYRGKIMAIVDRKAAGEAIVSPPVPSRPAPVADLVSALKSSLEELKKVG